MVINKDWHSSNAVDLTELDAVLGTGGPTSVGISGEMRPLGANDTFRRDLAPCEIVLLHRAACP